MGMAAALLDPVIVVKDQDNRARQRVELVHQGREHRAADVGRLGPQSVQDGLDTELRPGTVQRVRDM